MSVAAVSYDNEQSSDSVHDVYRHIEAEIGTMHSDALQTERGRRVHRIMLECGSYMRKLHQDLLRTEHARTHLESDLGAIDSHSEYLGRAVTAGLTSLMQAYLRAMQNMYSLFNQTVSGIEKSHRSQSNTVCDILERGENRLKLISDAAQKEQQESLYLLTSERGARYSKIKSASSTAATIRHTEMDNEIGSLNASRTDAIRLFEDGTDKLGLSHQSLEVKFNLENEKLKVQEHHVQDLIRQVNRLGDIANLGLRKPELFQKKHDLITILRSIKSKIHHESKFHEAKLLELAKAHDTAKSKLESEQRLVSKIERVFRQSKLTLRDQGPILNRESLLSRLGQVTAALALQNHMLEIEKTVAK
jgi:hypothetical protein